MVSKKIEGGYVLRLVRGEELVKTLSDFCEKKKVHAGWVSGIGGVVNAQVGYYHLTRKKYVFRHIKDVRELTHLSGNIARVGDQVALHLHGTFTDIRNKAFGGHIRTVEVGGTAEIHLREFKEPLTREQDADVGLPLLKL